jgi:hypothetical protein
MIVGVSNQFGMSDLHRFLYFKIFPNLEIYDLAVLEKNAKVTWKTYRINDKGKAFLAFAGHLLNQSKVSDPKETNSE